MYAISMNTRTIFHVDMDAFFASIEILRNPELRGKPVIVGGNPEKRGVVSTCSYEARKYGVRSAMSLFEAKRRCPHGIFVEGSFSLYRDYSDRVMSVCETLTPCLEVVGIDEAYMDVTTVASEDGGAFKLGQLLRRKVFQETELTCSVGIGSNKLIAKIGSSFAKPNGLFEVPAGQEVAFLAPLPIESIPGIGSKTQAFLNLDGIRFVKDLQVLGLETLIQRYGAHGYYFYLAAMGHDNRPVECMDQPPKSIGAETTFEVDQNDREVLLEALSELFDKAYLRMRRHQMRTRGISVKLRFTDFKTITRAMTFDTHINDYDLLLSNLTHLFERTYDYHSPLRLIGITLEKLTDSYWQPTLWDWAAEQNSPY
jgi:DNA polymerase IV